MRETQPEIDNWSREKDPAFPITLSLKSIVSPGMSKRDYISALALQGVLSGPNSAWEPKTAAQYAVKYADSLLEVLENGAEPI